MTEPAAYLDKARQMLKEANAVSDIDLPEAAGRAAYLAAFHAAQALILSRTGKVAKTHQGVQTEFARLAKAEPGIDRSLSTFLARSYKLKSVADYDVGGDAVVTATEAAAAIDTAGCFIECIAGLI